MSRGDINAKQSIKPSTFLNPVPVVMATCGTMENSNIITLAWAGTINSEPPMLSISIRKERFSHDIIAKDGIFGVNLVSRPLIKACDYCGVKSGRDIDKFKELKLTKYQGKTTGIPLIKESPASLECKVRQIIELGTHDMFIADILDVHVSKELFDAKGAIDMQKADLVAYNHGEYYTLGQYLGFYGYSVAGKEALARRLRK